MHRPLNLDASNGVCSIYHQMNQFMGYNYSNRTRLLGLKASNFPNANTNICSKLTIIMQNVTVVNQLKTTNGI